MSVRPHQARAQVIRGVQVIRGLPVTRSVAALFDPDERETMYRNVDLEIRGNTDCSALATELSAKLMQLHADNERGHFSTYEVMTMSADSPSKAILELVRVIRRLSPRARKQWQRLRQRRFDVGIQAGLEPRSHETVISAQALAALVAVGGELAITTYAPMLVARRRRVRARARTKK